MRLAVVFRWLILAGVGYACGVAALQALPVQLDLVIPCAEFRQLLLGFSPDGKRLAVVPAPDELNYYDISFARTKNYATWTDPIWIWDLAQHRRVQIHWSSAEDGAAVALAENPSARSSVWWRFLDDPEWRVELWEFMTKVPFEHVRDGSWTDPRLSDWRHQFSPDGRFIVRRCYEFSQGDVWEVVDWSRDRRLAILPWWAESPAFSPDGTTVVAARLKEAQPYSHPRYAVVRWNLADGGQITAIEWVDYSQKIDDDAKNVFWVRRIEPSPNGRWIVDSPNFNAVVDTRVLDVPRGLIIRDPDTFAVRFFVPDVAWPVFAHANRAVVSIANRGGNGTPPQLHLLDLDCRANRFVNLADSDTEIWRVHPQSGGPLVAVLLSRWHSPPWSNWPRVATWLQSLGIRPDRSESDIALIDVTSGNVESYLSDLNGESGVDEMQIAFSPDGKRLAVLAGDAIRIWQLPIRRPWWLVVSLPLIPAGALLYWGVRRSTRCFVLLQPGSPGFLGFSLRPAVDGGSNRSVASLPGTWLWCGRLGCTAPAGRLHHKRSSWASVEAPGVNRDRAAGLRRLGASLPTPPQE